MKNNQILKEFLKYALLNALGMLGLACYILADTFFISKGLGANGLAALNLAIPIFSFISGAGLMLGMGGATRYSIAKSRNEREEANQAFSNTLYLAAIIATIFFGLGILFSGVVTNLLGADEVIYSMCKTYLQVILLFAPMFILNNVMLSFVRNDGSPGLAMVAMLTGSIANIILDYIFIFPMQMGIFGAVFATCLAPIISLGVLSIYFIHRKNKFIFVKCQLSKSLSRAIFSNGLPSLITEVSSGVVIIVFNMIILQLQGNIGVAAYGVIANLSLIVISVYNGVAQGMQPIISKNFGLKENDAVRSILRYGLLLITFLSLVVYLIMFFNTNQIVNIFNSEQNVLFQAIANKGIKIYFIGCVFAGYNIILAVYFTSIENVRPAHIISLLRGFIVIIPLAFLLSSLGGIIGVWWVFPLSETIVFGIGSLMYMWAIKRKSALKLQIDGKG